MENKNHVILALLLPLVVILCGHPAYAEGLDWSSTANTTMSVFQFTTQIISASLLCLGIAFLGNACLKFKYHRDNPVQTPLNQPVTMFILATIMLLFAVFVMVSQNYVYNTADKTASVTQVFHSSLNPRPAPAPAPAMPLPGTLAQNAEDKIDLDMPY